METKVKWESVSDSATHDPECHYSENREHLSGLTKYYRDFKKVQCSKCEYQIYLKKGRKEMYCSDNCFMSMKIQDLEAETKRQLLELEQKDAQLEEKNFELEQQERASDLKDAQLERSDDQIEQLKSELAQQDILIKKLRAANLQENPKIPGEVLGSIAHERSEPSAQAVSEAPLEGKPPGLDSEPAESGAKEPSAEDIKGDTWPFYNIQPVRWNAEYDEEDWDWD